MVAGGVREMNEMQPLEGKQRGGHTSGRQAVESGRLVEASLKGGAKSREIARRFRTARGAEPQTGV
jgi:hypothetical protein